MTSDGIETEVQRLKRHKRIRFVKKLLRPLPRRATVHRYPILKYFANTARKRAYLWEFKRSYTITAIWIGWFIALIPMYGLQMIVAFLLSLIFRANAIVAMLLQWITNPVTIPPILYFQYKLGDWMVCKLGMEPLETDFAQIVSEKGILELLETLTDRDLIIHIASACLLGGFVISVLGASITTLAILMRSSSSKNLTKFRNTSK